MCVFVCVLARVYASVCVRVCVYVCLRVRAYAFARVTAVDVGVRAFIMFDFAPVCTPKCYLL